MPAKTPTMSLTPILQHVAAGVGALLPFVTEWLTGQVSWEVAAVTASGVLTVYLASLAHVAASTATSLSRTVQTDVGTLLHVPPASASGVATVA